jgi:hypothetical protein
VGCGVWSVECGVWGVECGVWGVGCRVWGVPGWPLGRDIDAEAAEARDPPPCCRDCAPLGAGYASFKSKSCVSVVIQPLHVSCTASTYSHKASSYHVYGR